VFQKAANRSREIMDATVPREYDDFGRVLRNFIKDVAHPKNTVPYPDRGSVHGMSIYTSHPEWLVQRWERMFGLGDARKLCEFGNTDSHLTIRANLLKTDPGALVEQLKEQGYSVMKARYASTGYYVSGRGEIFQTPQFLGGLFEIQDESSQLFVEWCDPQPDQCIMDVCAGAGGKTLAMSASTGNRATLIAGDVNRRALDELSHRAERNGSTIDVSGLSDQRLLSLHEKADIVLVDAPCSGLGTLSRNPDIKARIQEDGIERLSGEQLDILNKYAGCVKRGGRLIYATCTLTEEENECVITRFLEDHPQFVIDQPPGDRWKMFTSAEGYFYVLPHKHNLNGFFGCQLKRVR